jgi:uncharacterized protein YegJ (DUF2314 family)
MQPLALLSISLLSGVLLLSGCGSWGVGRNSTDPVITNFDQGKMDVAQARARASVDDFITSLRVGTADYYGVKHGFTTVTNGEEHCWISNLRYQDGKFTGTIDNEPEAVPHLKVGDTVTVDRSEISDWMVRKNDVIYGAYTLRVLLEKRPDEAKEYKLADPDITVVK